MDSVLHVCMRDCSNVLAQGLFRQRLARISSGPVGSDAVRCWCRKEQHHGYRVVHQFPCGAALLRISSESRIPRCRPLRYGTNLRGSRGPAPRPHLS